MPCNHKFQTELGLEELSYEPVTLIVGTFNPEWPETNYAPWFYGRTADELFWDVVPRLYGKPSLINAAPADWKQFCKDEKIALTDLISCIEDAEPGNATHVRALGGFADKAIEYNFEDFVFVNIVKLLKRYPSIKQVYFTRGITEPMWRHLWNPIMQYCSQNQLHERRLLPPNTDVSYHHAAYNQQHPDSHIPLLQDYILMRWQQEWHGGGN